MRQYYQTKINKKTGQNTRKFFDAVKENMGESKNLELKKVESKLESFSNFFADIGKKLQINLVLNALHKENETYTKKIVNSPFKRTTQTHYTNETYTKKIVNSPFLQKTTIMDLCKILSDIKQNCRVDAFNLNNSCIRLLAPSISTFICEVFNCCLNFGLFPDCVKIAKVIPIFKEGDKTDPSNSLPISLLPVASKTFEKIIYNRIFVFLNKEKVLNENQFDLRQDRSTIDALVEFSKIVRLNWLHSKQNTISAFLDLKKAFDIVDNQILLAKCSNYGLRGLFCKF